MAQNNLSELIEQAQEVLQEIAQSEDYQTLLNDGYQPDLNVADAQTALQYLSGEIE
jgi:hypothetical protein